MIKNYLKLAFRNLYKNKVYSLINISGLAVGIACCLLIILYVQQELSYDQFHRNSDRIYRAWTEETTPGGRELFNTATPIPLHRALVDNIPEVQAAAYIYSYNNEARLPESSESLNESFWLTNNDFFRIFDFTLTEGTRENLLERPDDVVLSESAAARYFGDAPALGKTLRVRIGEEFRDFTVSGVLEDPPANSSLQYNAFLPFQLTETLVSERARNSWFNVFGATYLLTDAGTNPASLKEPLHNMLLSSMGSETVEQNSYKVGLQPLTDIHLNPDFPTMFASVTDPAYTYLLGAIALLILFIACINFMTLSVSRSESRSREVGIRKTLGAVRKHLMLQFWGESLLITLLSLIVGVTLTELLIPYFNELSGTLLSLNFSLQQIGLMLMLAAIIAIIAGIYPAIVLSGFEPAKVLKGHFDFSGDKSLFRKVMVITQFAMSVALITSTLTVHKQLNYVQTKSLGYQKDNLMVIDTGINSSPGTSIDATLEEARRMKDLMNNRLGSSDGVNRLSLSIYTPSQTGGWFSLGYTGTDDQAHSFHGNVVDENFIPAMQLEMAAGRNFSEEIPSDSRRAIIINEAMAEYYGWDDPLGKRIPGPDFTDHEVIGVVKDFHYRSLHADIEPLALSMSADLFFSGINDLGLSNSPSPRFLISYTTSDLPALISSLTDLWGELAPGSPFSFSFVDEALERQYRQEERLARIVTWASGIAIFIACMGLFGLASLMVVRRRKEIGVRKVLGASSPGIVYLINKEFTLLIVIAFLIGAPVSWYLIQDWLQDFAYRAPVGPGIYSAAGILTLLVAWFTVSYQTFKATMIDPAKSLRTE